RRSLTGTPIAHEAAAEPQEEDDHARASPLVRKIAREHNVNLSQVPGTGMGGRITKQDIMAFLDKPELAVAPADSAGVRAPAPLSAGSSPRSATASPAAIPGDMVPMTQMRKIIA